MQQMIKHKVLSINLFEKFIEITEKMPTFLYF